MFEEAQNGDPRLMEAASMCYVHMFLQPCFHGSLIHMVPLSVTICLPVHFILTLGHVEYEIGVPMA